MAILKKEFGEFHTAIRLGPYEENEELRTKRNLLIDELTESIKDEKIPGTENKLTFSKFDQGSYAMSTGIIPEDDDFDIDVGIIFAISNTQYDSGNLKKLVFDKLDAQHNRSVEYNRPCITVKYSTGYHVDLAIYSENDADHHIAWGKQYSADKLWYKSEPKKLTKWVSDVSDDALVSSQFRRSVRYLKKWKDKHFSSDGNLAPPSIGLTIQARHAFSTYSAYKKDSDIEALLNVAKHIISDFINVYDNESESYKKSVSINLPVEPFKNVYYKMTLNYMDSFYEKLEALIEALQAAIEEESEHEASKILIKVFGDGFPLKEDTKRTATLPYVPSGNNA